MLGRLVGLRASLRVLGGGGGGAESYSLESAVLLCSGSQEAPHSHSPIGRQSKESNRRLPALPSCVRASQTSHTFTAWQKISYDSFDPEEPPKIALPKYPRTQSRPLFPLS